MKLSICQVEVPFEGKTKRNIERYTDVESKSFNPIFCFLLNHLPYIAGRISNALRDYSGKTKSRTLTIKIQYD